MSARVHTHTCFFRVCYGITDVLETFITTTLDFLDTKMVPRFSNKAIYDEHFRSFKIAIYPKIKNIKQITDEVCLKILIYRFPEYSQQSHVLLREIRGNIYIQTSYNNNCLRTDSKIDF